jgi:hypothetical protein
MDPSAVTVTVHNNLSGAELPIYSLLESCVSLFIYMTTGRLIYMTQQRFDWSGGCDEKLTDPVVSDKPPCKLPERQPTVL